MTRELLEVEIADHWVRIVEADPRPTYVVLESALAREYADELEEGDE